MMWRGEFRQKPMGENMTDPELCEYCATTTCDGYILISKKIGSRDRSAYLAAVEIHKL